MAKRKKERSGWTHPLRHFAQQLQGNRGDALSFQLCGYQTHGLVAHRSDGYQQRDVDPVGRQEPCRLGRRVLDEFSGRGNRTHEGYVPMVHRADAAALGELPEPIQREGEVRIRPHAAMIEGTAPMALHKGGRIHVSGDFTETGVAASH